MTSVKSAAEHWSAALAESWGIEAPLSPLDGEHDLNFRVENPAGAILKVMRPGCDRALIDLQIAAMQHILARAPQLPIPRPIAAADGGFIVEAADPAGARRLLWLISELPGRVYGSTRPQTHGAIEAIGQALGEIDAALADFDHPALGRALKWNLTRASWIAEHVGLIGDPGRRALVGAILDRYETACRPRLDALPAQAIHNDVNDYNILVETGTDGRQRLTGLIDFGDAIRAPAICDLAIAGAYLVLDQARPVEALAHLVAGYSRGRPLSEAEVELLWPLLLTRLAVSVVNAAVMKRERPDDPYVTISEAPAWRFLDRVETINPALARVRLRRAAGLPPAPDATAVIDWIAGNRATFAPVFGRSLAGAPVLDLSVAGADSPQDPLSPDIGEMSAAVAALAADGAAVLGRYGEPRLIYGGADFRVGDHPATDRRTMHIGIDVFLPAGTPVCAPLDGVVHSAAVMPDLYDYGGLVTLRHETAEGGVFYTLYGHLARQSAERLSPGQAVTAGEPFVSLGGIDENGGWPPHLHFQLGLVDLPGGAWPGVAFPDEFEDIAQLFPDPAPLLGLAPGSLTAPKLDIADLLARRTARTGKNLKLSYRVPVPVLRGWKNYLFDDRGRTYLDAYNNVPHVGHAHPRLTRAIGRQARLVNTNTRYLQPVLEAYAEAMAARLPDPLEVCFFVNSGSEANELAVRLARAYTGAKDMIVSRAGYHGNTCLAIDLSDYKFSGKGGAGRRDWVHVAEVPDIFRGPYKADDPEAGEKYAADVGRLVAEATAAQRRIAAFISEPFPSVAGQIIPPPGYLKAVYAHVRAGGGLCIADEVQTGLGRLGRCQWGFEQQGALPDIVVLGKPIGNGHPLGAVITTRAIADAFANGMEFFSTFGGSTLSCTVGLEVLRILDDEDLPGNAEVVGSHLIAGLKALGRGTPAVGDVRGLGFFLGVEMVRPDGAPAPELAGYVVNRLRERRILIGSDGPHDNVLKIRPPLCFGRQDADYLLAALAEIFAEAPLAP